jgi:hypothetical protein
VLESSKLGQLLRKRWTGEIPDDSAPQTMIDEVPDSADSSATESIDVTYDYEPPGQISQRETSVSKLIMPAVRVDPWSIFWLILVSITGGTGILSYILLTAVPPLPDCKQISLLSTDSQRLYCAKIWAETNERGRVLAALNVVKGWSEFSPLYFDGKNLANEWSWQLIRLTKQELLADGDLNKAVNSLKTIPTFSAAYPEAKKTIDKWEKQWQKGRAIEAKFKKSIIDGDWGTGYDLLAKLRSSPNSYWSSTRHSQMSLQFAREKEGWDRFQDAESIAHGENPEDYKAFRRSAKKTVVPLLDGESEAVFYVIDPNVLTKAIGLAAKVPANSYFKEKANARQELWSKTIITVATEKLRVKKYEEAIAIAKQVPRGLKIYTEAQSLIAQSRSGSAQQSPAAEQKPGEVLDNYMLLTRAQQFGLLGSLESMNNAIILAKNIPADQPLWTEAQTFIKFWNQQVQVIKDQPTVDKAREIARRGDLAKAIKTGSTLPTQSIAYRNLQHEIQQWQETLTILTIQRDKKVLANAALLYQGGQRNTAIAIALRVPTDSPMHAEAQNTAKRWQQEQSRPRPTASKSAAN